VYCNALVNTQLIKALPIAWREISQGAGSRKQNDWHIGSKNIFFLAGVIVTFRFGRALDGPMSFLSGERYNCNFLERLSLEAGDIPTGVNSSFLAAMVRRLP